MAKQTKQTNNKKKATKKPVKKTAKVVKLEEEFNSQYFLALSKSNLIQIKNDNNDITIDEIMKMMDICENTLTDFIVKDSELLELFEDEYSPEAMKSESVEVEQVPEEVPEVEKIPTQDLWLIDYFTGRDTETFNMNTTQVTMIAAIWKKMYNQVIDTGCKHQLMAAYITLFNYIESTYGSEKIKK